MKYIYLDQNRWIELSRGWHEKNKEIYPFVEELKLKVNNKEIIFVISLMHIKETLKQGNRVRGKKLLDFMIYLSEGNYICPFSRDIVSLEIKNIFYKRLGRPLINIKKYIFGKRFDKIISFWGGKIISKEGTEIPEEVKNKMELELMSLENFYKIFASDKSFDSARKSGLENIRFVKVLEKVRIKERTQFKDSRYQAKVILARHLVKELSPEIALWGCVMKLPISFLKKDLGSQEKVIKLFQELPSEYTYFSLTDKRDRDLSKKIEPNDLYDIMALSVAVPYCDIVWTEKRFGTMARALKMDKICKTKIPKNLDEFKSLISK